jgi:two-component system nitrate/nitrite response regulator NarL
MNVLKRVFRLRPAPTLAQLTRRERQVLELVAAGDTNKMIALKLSTSESTVKNHCTSIYRKLNVRNRVGAATVYSKQ